MGIDVIPDPAKPLLGKKKMRRTFSSQFIPEGVS